MDMHAFQSPEDLLADESFLAWYYKTDPGAVDKWQEQIGQSPSLRVLAAKAIELLEKLDLREMSVPQAQIDAAEARLFGQIDALGRAEGATRKEVTREEVTREDASKVLQLPSLAPGELRESRPRRKSRRTWMAAAAGVVLLVAAGWGAKTWMGRKKTLSTPYGQIAKSVLPDGTEVTLNAHSSLVYGLHWSEGADREVWVKGEVFLHVAKKPLHDRFIVHTDHFDVIVTGTSFDVVNREDAASVVLKEGHVTVRGNGGNEVKGNEVKSNEVKGNEVKMEPGDEVQLEGTELVKQSVNPEEVIAWTEEKIAFDSATLADVAKMIEQHYGVRVSIERTALLSYPVNGLMRNDNLGELLKALSALYYKDLNIRREGDQIIIR